MDLSTNATVVKISQMRANSFARDGLAVSLLLVRVIQSEARPASNDHVQATPANLLLTLAMAKNTVNGIQMSLGVFDCLTMGCLVF